MRISFDLELEGWSRDGDNGRNKDGMVARGSPNAVELENVMNGRVTAPRRRCAVGACIWMIGVVGCSDGRVKTYPVHGEVSYKGHPVATGIVTFSPMTEGQPAARGRLQSDGKFSLGTYGVDDGAAAGAHVIVVSSFSAPTARPDLPADDPHQRMPTPLVPIRYTSVRKSPLRATVEDRENDVVIVLTD
jgi:hypothetical protein